MISEHARGYADGHREAVEAAARLFQEAISDGYDVPARKVDQCQHGRFGWEDCIACYDEALTATVEKVRALVPANTPREGGDG